MISNIFGLMYEKFSDGFMIVGYDDSAPVSLEILSELDGRPVVGIEDYAFNGCESLEELIIPEGIAKIGDDAFRSCTRLKSVVLPKSIKKIGIGAFLGCSALTSFTVAESNKSYCVENGVLYDKRKSTLLSCVALRSSSFTVPDSVTVIADRAFEKCSGLVNISISTGVTRISWDAFKDCTSLEAVTLPDSITEIYSGAFYGCTALTSVTIPDSVTKIGDDAFSCCPRLERVTIPDSVTSIGNEAFGYGRYDYSKRTKPIEGFEIHASRGSTAEKYAEENGFKFIAV